MDCFTRKQRRCMKSTALTAALLGLIMLLQWKRSVQHQGDSTALKGSS